MVGILFNQAYVLSVVIVERTKLISPGADYKPVEPIASPEFDD